MVGEVNDVAAALRLLPHAPCILVANSAEHVASVVAQTPRSHPAPVVHDLQALGRWGGCDDAVGKDACVAAMQMLLLGECSAMIGSLDRYNSTNSFTMQYIAVIVQHLHASQMCFLSHIFAILHQCRRESRVQPNGSKRKIPACLRAGNMKLIR